MIKRLCIWILGFPYALQSSSICFGGVLLAFPSLYPLFHFQLPWTVINKLPVYAAISFLANFYSYKKKKNIFFLFFLNFLLPRSIQSEFCVCLASIHQSQPVRGPAGLLVMFMSRGWFFFPHTKFILITSSEMLGVASLPFATTRCLCPAMSAL